MTSLKTKILAILIIGSIFLALFGVQIGNWIVYLVATIIFASAGLYIEWDKYRSFRQIFRHFFSDISEPFLDIWRRITGR